MKTNSRFSFNKFSEMMDHKLKNIPLSKIRLMCKDLIKGDSQIPSIKKMNRTTMMSYIVATTSLILSKKYPLDVMLKDLEIKYKIKLNT